MATTAIKLTNEQGILVPSQPSVTVSSGDTVSFSTSDGSTAYLFFSPAAAAALSPAPTYPVEVSTGTTFQFTSSIADAYSVYFETSAGVTVPDFPVAPSNLLMLEIDANPSFSVIIDHTKG